MRLSKPVHVFLELLLASSVADAFSGIRQNPALTRFSPTRTKMAGGDGSDKEWAKALQESTGMVPGQMEKDMKMKGLLGNKQGQGDPKVTANGNLIQWLQEEGEVYLAEESSWGEAPHPLAISTETKDEITNESSGRGLLARKDINESDELLRIPMKLCLTKASARKALGKETLPEDINEYLAIACQLIHERFVLKEKSSWKPYIDVLPETSDVNPTFTWPDEDLEFLAGSPVIAATKSLQNKLKFEYTALFEGDKGLFAKFPDRFPKEVRSHCIYLILLSFQRLLFPPHQSKMPRKISFHSALYVCQLGMGVCQFVFTCHSSS